MRSRSCKRESSCRAACSCPQTAPTCFRSSLELPVKTVYRWSGARGMTGAPLASRLTACCVRSSTRKAAVPKVWRTLTSSATSKTRRPPFQQQDAVTLLSRGDDKQERSASRKEGGIAEAQDPRRLRLDGASELCLRGGGCGPTAEVHYLCENRSVHLPTAIVPGGVGGHTRLGIHDPRVS